MMSKEKLIKRHIMCLELRGYILEELSGSNIEKIKKNLNKALWHKERLTKLTSAA